MKPAKIFIIFTFLLAFALQDSAQVSPFPNELKGYEFFGKAKLKDLMIAFSTKEDVKNIFGSDCREDCDYDENWTVSFFYFGDGSALKIKDKTVFPKEEFNEKVWSVAFVPKKKISFRETKFPREFKSFVGYAKGCSSDEKCKQVGPKLKYYVNSYGLSYEICKQSNKLCNKDDLYAIRYDLTKELEEEIFDLKTK